MTYDVTALRARIPALEEGTAYFDGPGGTQTPREIGDAIAEALCAPLSNRGTGAASQRNAERHVEQFRAAGADLLGSDPRGIVHGRSATALTYDLARALAATWQPGDEVVVTSLDHDSNVRPWIQAAERVGAVIRWWELDPATGELPLAALREVVGERTRLVAMTGASNLLGTIPDVAGAAEITHDAGALLHVDAVHLAAHRLVDREALGADSLVCSPYKFLGPHCGVLAADPALLDELHPDKLLPSTDAVPERFELGTLPYELLAGVTATVDLIAGLAPGDAPTRRARLRASWEAVHEHEHRLHRLLEDSLVELPRVRVLSRAQERTPTSYLVVDGVPGDEVSRGLLEQGVLAPAGHFYAYEAWRRLGLEPDVGVRVGLAPYTSDEDVHRLVEALGALAR